MPPATAECAATVQVKVMQGTAPLYFLDVNFIRRQVEELYQHDLLLSENRFESQILAPISSVRNWGPSPSQFYEDEVLDWDFPVSMPSPRRTGTLMVGLRYDGRATPQPMTNPWD